MNGADVSDDASDDDDADDDEDDANSCKSALGR